MIWSKQQRIFQDLLADPLRGRLKVHSTSFRNDPRRLGRAWVEFDQREICRFVDYKLSPEPGGEEDETGAIHRRDTRSRRDFLEAFAFYLNADIDECLASSNDIVRALAFLDRRFGKRRVERVRREESQALRGLPRLFFEIRCEAEGQAPAAG